jgi:hypothetical protein
MERCLMIMSAIGGAIGGIASDVAKQILASTASQSGQSQTTIKGL